jgi:hypothetical protein
MIRMLSSIAFIPSHKRITPSKLCQIRRMIPSHHSKSDSSADYHAIRHSKACAGEWMVAPACQWYIQHSTALCTHVQQQQCIPQHTRVVTHTHTLQQQALHVEGEACILINDATCGQCIIIVATSIANNVVHP